MFAYSFMVNAFLAASLVALAAGPYGYFLVLRRQTFASHALAHLGFTGGTGAVLIGLSPWWGMVGITMLGGAGMGWLGESLAGRDVAIGMVLAVALGLGLLFLHLYTAFATQATALLFGNVLGTDSTTLWQLLAVTIISLSILALIARPLLFLSLQSDIATARGVRPRRLSIAFLALVALVTAACSQIVGVLLVFSLMIGPAATAHRLTGRPLSGLIISALLAIAQAWTGLALAYATDWPVSFWIAALSATIFGITGLPIDSNWTKRQGNKTALC